MSLFVFFRLHRPVRSVQALHRVHVLAMPHLDMSRDLTWPCCQKKQAMIKDAWDKIQTLKAQKKTKDDPEFVAAHAEFVAAHAELTATKAQVCVCLCVSVCGGGGCVCV